MFPYAENSRSLGLADFAKAMETGRYARCDWHQTLHILEIMDSFTTSSDTGKYIALTSKYQRSEPLNPENKYGIID